MAKHITAFLLDRVPGTDEARLRCRVKWDGCRQSVAVSVGHRVNVARWDMDRQRCVPRSFHGRSRVPAAVINEDLDRIGEAADAAFVKIKQEGRTPDPAEIREALVKAVRPDRAKDPETGNWKKNVFHAFTHFMAERGERNRWTDATYKKMMNVRRHLQEWRPSLKWSDFNEDGLFSYVAHLRTSTRMDNRSDRSGLRDSTVEKHVSFLKWFLSWADQKGLLKCRDYINFRPKLQTAEKPVIFHEWDELLHMYSLDLSERPELAPIRDIFCFCAFTSLRYSDVRALRWSDVYADSLHVTTQKTTDALVIELNDYSQELLGRYVDEGLPEDRVFPVPTNQTMNEKLKELGELCGFSQLIRVTEFRNGRRYDALLPKWSLLGTHAARRTFICNALMMGIAPNVVMRWTGHSDYDSMKPYIAIADTAKAQAMSKFNKKNRD